MERRKILGAARLLMAAIVLIAVGTQLALSIDAGRSVVNFFSFFTIQSNLFSAAVFLVVGYISVRGHSIEHLAMWRGTAALYMIVVGVTYYLLLAGLEDQLQTSDRLVNFVVHYLFPWVATLDWLVDPPRQKIEFRSGLVWLVFPLVYLGYSLIRGALTDWYPYPFLDAGENGYVSVVVVTAVILACAVGLVWVLCWWSGAKKVQRRSPQPAG